MSADVQLILFDSYGVVLHGGYPSTCKALARKYNKDWKGLYELFYKKHFNMAAERRITQQAAWERSIKEADIPISVGEVKKIHYGFMSPNKDVMRLAARLQKKYTTVLLTKNTRTQLRDARNKIPDIDRVFGGRIINTWEYGLPKASAKTIRFVCERYKVKPQEIIYIDDQKENLVEPKKLGVHIIHFQDFKQLQDALSALIAI